MKTTAAYLFPENPISFQCDSGTLWPGAFSGVYCTCVLPLQLEIDILMDIFQSAKVMATNIANIISHYNDICITATVVCVRSRSFPFLSDIGYGRRARVPRSRDVMLELPFNHFAIGIMIPDGRKWRKL